MKTLIIVLAAFFAISTTVSAQTVTTTSKKETTDGGASFKLFNDFFANNLSKLVIANPKEFAFGDSVVLKTLVRMKVGFSKTYIGTIQVSYDSKTSNTQYEIEEISPTK